MTPTLAQIWRYPVKGIGAEALEHVDLRADAPLPGDRAWAVSHARAEQHDNWQARNNFVVVATGPALAGITAKTHTDGRFTLSHFDGASLTFDPGSEGDRLLNWIAPFWPDGQAAPRRLQKAPPESMADNGAAQVSIMNLASLRALGQKLGATLDPRRFRGNLWLDGLAPWEEFDWIGRDIRIGDVSFAVTERIERCRATEANPETGRRDLEPVRALHAGWGHRDFGVYATVRSNGALRPGAEVHAA